MQSSREIYEIEQKQRLKSAQKDIHIRQICVVPQLTKKIPKLRSQRWPILPGLSGRMVTVWSI